MTAPIRYTIDLDDLDGDPTWPTQRRDMAAALAIIDRHQTASGNGLRLLDDWGETDAETLWVKLPAWLRELSAHYHRLYGNHAPDIMQRVLRVLIPETAGNDEILPHSSGRGRCLH